MSHSGVPGVEQVAGFMGGGDAPTPTPAPAQPTPATSPDVQEAEEEAERAQGESANVLAGAGNYGSPQTSRQVLLGS